jgi:hypothetical protein
MMRETRERTGCLDSAWVNQSGFPVLRHGAMAVRLGYRSSKRWMLRSSGFSALRWEWAGSLPGVGVADAPEPLTNLYDPFRIESF